MEKPWKNHEKTMKKPWKNHGKTMEKPWKNHGARSFPAWLWISLDVHVKDEIHTGGVEWEDVKVGTGALRTPGESPGESPRGSVESNEF